MATSSKKTNIKVTFSRNNGKRTSIGRSTNSRPKGKNDRKQYKKYRGQGYP